MGGVAAGRVALLARLFVALAGGERHVLTLAPRQDI